MSIISNVLRTPEDRFRNLRDFSFQPHYTEVEGMRMHYIDENSTSEKTIVLVHGEPTWSYLYRKMIPLLSRAGYRVIVPDLIGFGKSDKPVDKKIYTYPSLVRWMEVFLFAKLDLSGINVVLHDWGGLIGLRIVAEHPERFTSVTAMNTALPRLEGFNPVFYLWRVLCSPITHIPFKKLIPLGMKSQAEPVSMAAYDAPFPDRRYKVAPLRLPKLVPLFPWEKEAAENRRIWEKLRGFDKPFLTIYSDKDPFTKLVEEDFITSIAGAKGQDHVKIRGAGHLIQEDKPELVSHHILSFLEKNAL